MPEVRCCSSLNPFLPRFRALRGGVLALLCLTAAWGAHGALALQRERTSPYDLILTGRLAGVPGGEKRYVRWSELRALPTSKLKLAGEFVKGEQELTVVFLTDLWAALPRGAGADTLLATCASYQGALAPSAAPPSAGAGGRTAAGREPRHVCLPALRGEDAPPALCVVHPAPSSLLPFLPRRSAHKEPPFWPRPRRSNSSSRA